MSSSLSRLRLLAFVPSGRAPSETFIRANLRGLPFETVAYFGDEFSWRRPLQLSYAVSVSLSKVLYKLGLRKFGTFPPSLVAWFLCCHHRPNALIVEFGFHAVRMMEGAAWSGIPLVVQFHGADAFARNRVLPLRERYRRLFRITAGVVVKSEPMRRQLIHVGARPSQLVVSPCGADSSLFYGAMPESAPPCFIAVGRFVPKKAPLLSIRAFAAACADVSSDLSRELRLVMVGEGPLLSEARQLVDELDLKDQISFPGLRSPHEVAELMRTCRGFVQHSMLAPDGDSEGSPVSVVEAQLSGLPVVSTRHAGIPEVVLEGETGFLVDEGDVFGMAAHIVRLANEPGLAGCLGSAASRRASSFFTIQHHLRDVTSIIESVAIKSKS